MKVVNIELKARCENKDVVRRRLHTKNAVYKGIDRQIDTYFDVRKGRLKLREGNIERSLIYYNRLDRKSIKQSDVLFEKLEKPTDILKSQLATSIGIKVVVDKRREIYFIDNVKFHIDEVADLGQFVEIEAIGRPGEETELQKQCEYFKTYLGIKDSDLLQYSYSDMLLKNLQC